MRPETGNRHRARCDPMALAIVLAAEPDAPALHFLVPGAWPMRIVHGGAPEVVRGVPVIDPFPDIAGHVTESVAVGWELLGRAVAVEAVPDAVLPGEAAQPQVGLVDLVRVEFVHRSVGGPFAQPFWRRSNTPDRPRHLEARGRCWREHRVRMANRTYSEVIPRELTVAQQSELESLVSPAWYVCRVGRLNLRGLLTAFQGYYREHPESWVDRYGHREAGPQLVLHAYLHPVVKSRGRITRGYAVARGRTDLLIEWPTSRANSGVPCEQACH